jgi:hypothetical protein
MKIGLEVTRVPRKLFLSGESVFRPLALLKNPLRLFGVLPEVGLGGFFF